MRRPRSGKFARRPSDPSQQLRLGTQLLFLALNVWIGMQFVAWVRFMESGGATRAAARPPGIEGWLPIAALMNLKAFLVSGDLPRVHVAGLFLLIAFLTLSLLLRKSFCSWLCPIGTLSEWLWKLGQKAGSNAVLPKWLDIPLRGVKYALFGFFAWAIVRMPVREIVAFLEAPYGLVADVKLLNFFRHIGTTGLVILAVLLALSVIVKNFWCRYLCPYGALLGLTALVSPVSIRRDDDACIDCAKCAKACPSRLPVDRLAKVRSAECTLCMACVAACPAAGALDAKAARRRLPAWGIALAIWIVFLGIVAGARISGHWQSDVPEEVYRRLLGGP